MNCKHNFDLFIIKIMHIECMILDTGTWKQSYSYSCHKFLHSQDLPEGCVLIQILLIEESFLVGIK